MGNKPMIAFATVVFPLPLSPTTQSVSLLNKSNEILFTAAMLWFFLEKKDELFG
jgi:hypothetical protein